MEYVKNQHYVPQCYLESWKIQNTDQLAVYDKTKQESRLSHIRKCASEKYFYDFESDENISFWVQQLLNIPQKNTESDRFDNEQYIEHYLAIQIESEFSRLLKTIIGRVNLCNTKDYHSELLVTKAEKEILSFFLAIQFIRVKEVRNIMLDIGDCLEQFFQEENVSDEIKKKYLVSKKEIGNIHREMIINPEKIDHIKRAFLSHTWIFRINKTDDFFWTSDNPINIIPHIHDSVLSMNGLASKGVEISFSISPNILLTMFETSYHSTMKKYDCRMVILDETEDIDWYNKICVMQSSRYTYSSKDDFSLIDRIKETNPETLAPHHVLMNRGDKTYKPRGLSVGSEK